MNKLYCLFRLGFSAILFAVCCTACSLISLNEKPDDSERYGSLTIAPQNRALDVSLIHSAVVTVSGSGIKSDISKECGEVVNGRGSVFIEKIPIGKRRIISVYAKDVAGNLIDGGIIRAVVEIKGGANIMDIINRQTSRKGNVYNALFEKSIDIENISARDSSALEEAIPDDDDCELERIDIDSLVQDFIAYRNGGDPLKNQENYILPEAIYLKGIKIVQAADSSEENIKFTATAIYSNGSESPITEKAKWISSDNNIATVENGIVKLLKAGTLSISAEYSEDAISRISPKATLTVVHEEAGNPYIYLKIYGKDDDTHINYAYGGHFVAAWIWGTRLLSEWYPLEKTNEEGYMRVEIPKGAENIIFAHSLSFNEEKRNEWYGMVNVFDQTDDLKIPTDGKNTCVLDSWKGAKGTWSYVDHGDILESRIYATCKMEPSEDDTSLSSLKVNGTEISVANRVVYTVPYDTASAQVEVKANYSEAKVAVSPSYVQSLVNPGDVAEFIVTVTAKDGKNKQDYTVRVKRSAVAPLDLTPYKQCGYLEDDEEGTITFIYDPETWGENKDNVKSLVVVGSFTANYNPKTKKWVENTDDFTLSWNKEFGAFSLTVPREKVMRPGYSGQPEYKFYKNGLAQNEYPSKMPEKYIFGSTTKPMMILFKSDGEDRLSELEKNKEQASTFKKLSDFNTSSDTDLHKIANFRQLPCATNVYRSYHPFYPTNEKTETEKLRIESVQKFATEVGIKSDINLCNDRTPKQGNTITWFDYTTLKETTDQVAIPDYYKEIINRNSVLYMGDNDDGRPGNGYIPNAKLVYYYSHSEIFGQWVKQLIGFINDSKNSAPFQIHCEIGVDRTGVFCAVLAGLCGATWNDIKADYVSSNNMGIREFRDERMLKYSLENMLGVSDISAINIKNELYKHFTNGGYVTTSELDAAVKKLTENR